MVTLFCCGFCAIKICVNNINKPVFFFFCRTKDVDNNSFSESYKSNTPKEIQVLSFCENFRRQFVHLFRDRKPLFLSPKNEYAIEVNSCPCYTFFYCYCHGDLFNVCTLLAGNVDTY